MVVEADIFEEPTSIFLKMVRVIIDCLGWAGPALENKPFSLCFILPNNDILILYTNKLRDIIIFSPEVSNWATPAHC